MAKKSNQKKHLQFFTPLERWITVAVVAFILFKIIEWFLNESDSLLNIIGLAIILVSIVSFTRLLPWLRGKPDDRTRK